MVPLNIVILEAMMEVSECCFLHHTTYAMCFTSTCCVGFHLNTWQGESDSESDSDMEVEEEDDEDDEEDIIPSIDDVLDESSWRQRQRLHRKTSNSSGSTLTSVTTATSSSADLTHQRLSHSRSSTPPQSLHLLTTTTSSALPAA
ncbi:hypothetical protein EB796_007113 [Bugula neritina]|uniref:Uncharacterized protein n=1 Tax=Bugula neritina TaxID=10212 RepID=A0A7J7K8L6_BUGNE|nr:hypothetical protein EB796_007113 [Bugula neritina]